MTRTLLRAGALACALLTSTALTAPARAQQVTLTPPAVRATVDGNGVDLATGTVTVPEAAVSVGAEGSSLGFVQAVRNNRSYINHHGWIALSGSTYTVTLGGSAEIFTLSGGSFVPAEPRGASLTVDPEGVYVYTAPDGTRAIFNRTTGDLHFTHPTENSAPLLKQLIRPDGERLDYFYHMGWVQIDDDPLTIAQGARLTSVRSNTGYHLRFDYASSTLDDAGDVAAWSRIARVTALNAAVESCWEAPEPCQLINAWPELEIGWDETTRVQTFTNALDQQTRFTWTGGTSGQLLSSIRYPGSAGNDIAYSYDASNRVSAAANRGITTTYAYSDSAGIRTTTVTNPGGSTRVLTFNIAAGTLRSERDELQRTTSYEYDASNRLKRVIAPEENYVEYDYDSLGRITEVQAVAKPSSNSVRHRAQGRLSERLQQPHNLQPADQHDRLARPRHPL